MPRKSRFDDIGKKIVYFETRPSVFVNFESPIVNFESQTFLHNDLLASRIHAVTLCPMRCLKARLKVL